MTGYLLLAALLPIAFWIGWRAHLAYWLNGYPGMRVLHFLTGSRVPFDDDLWISKLAGPLLALFVWCGVAVYCAARGWL